MIFTSRPSKVKIILLNIRKKIKKKRNGHPFPRDSMKVIISLIVSKSTSTVKYKVYNYILLIIRDQPFSRSFMRFISLNLMLSDIVHIYTRAKRHLNSSTLDTFTLITKKNLVMNRMLRRG